jgi:hypothetical protein
MLNEMHLLYLIKELQEAPNDVDFECILNSVFIEDMSLYESLKLILLRDRRVWSYHWLGHFTGTYTLLFLREIVQKVSIGKIKLSTHTILDINHNNEVVSVDTILQTWERERIDAIPIMDKLMCVINKIDVSRNYQRGNESVWSKHNSAWLSSKSDYPETCCYVEWIDGEPYLEFLDEDFKRKFYILLIENQLIEKNPDTKFYALKKEKICQLYDKYV